MTWCRDRLASTNTPRILQRPLPIYGRSWPTCFQLLSHPNDRLRYWGIPLPYLKTRVKLGCSWAMFAGCLQFECRSADPKHRHISYAAHSPSSGRFRSIPSAQSCVEVRAPKAEKVVAMVFFQLRWPSLTFFRFDAKLRNDNCLGSQRNKTPCEVFWWISWQVVLYAMGIPTENIRQLPETVMVPPSSLDRTWKEYYSIFPCVFGIYRTAKVQNQVPLYASSVHARAEHRLC